MVLNTLTVGAAVTPTVIETYFSHYLNRRPLRQKPTAHIGYHEGLQLVREFLHYASNHTVDEIQAFTQQWVPVPHWVKQDSVTIPDEKLTESAALLQAQLGPEGIERVGGKSWWQWRRDDAPLKAEWIEMRKDYQDRKAGKTTGPQRIMLYIHGGAYYFGSVDEHRYQIQRHARKLRARVLAPRYRLSPQFPFPCGLHDSIAAYLWLLEEHDPSTIIVAGDSAGGGMVMSMLITLRDQGIPLPAGGILLSPWVDLTHSFPSLGGDGKFDYIPAHGFLHKPSKTWPPPNADDLAAIEQGSVDLQAKPGKVKGKKSKDIQEHKDAVRGFSVEEAPSQNGHPSRPGTAAPIGTSASAPPPPDLSITIDGKLITIKDQIQLYAANSQITHPLVSPVLQPTLGGLPPLLVQVGGGELLRDEQIYLAHKAASPMEYLPDLSHLTADQKTNVLDQVRKYGPTDVKLEIWDDLCHVAPTLSFTRPAKFMYRSIAQFGAWALARAQNTAIDAMADDNVSIISSTDESQSDPSGPSSRNVSKENLTSANGGAPPTINEHAQDDNNPKETYLNIPTTTTTPSGAPITVESVGRAGDPLPPFHHHMIRQRISRHGYIRPLEPASSLECLNLPPSSIGVIKEGPVRKWLAAQSTWNKKFAKEKLAVQRKRTEEMARGFEGWEGERPPPTALAGRRTKDMPGVKRVGRSWGLAMWSGWGSKHDETTIQRGKKADDEERPNSKSSRSRKGRKSASEASGTARGRTQSRQSVVPDQSQTTGNPDPTSPSSPNINDPTTVAAPIDGPTTPNIIISATPTSAPTILPPSNTTSTRPTKEGIAYPFKLATSNHRPNPSTVTLTSLGLDSGSEGTQTPGARTPGVGTPTNEEMKEMGDSGVSGVNGEIAGVARKEEVLVVEGGEVKKVVERQGEEAERPAPERFVTAVEF